MTKMSINQFAVLGTGLSDKIDFEASIAFNTIKELRVVGSRVLLKYIQSGNVSVLLELICYFEIAETDWVKLLNGDKVKLPKVLLSHIAMHTVGSARGVMFCKTEGTPYQRIIVPPINVEAIVPDGIEL